MYLTIGRNRKNAICFNNKFVSGNHARLTYDGSVWSISDIGSTNGTFVNDYRIETQPLRYGDYIYIMELKIVVGKQFFAINNLDNQVRIVSSEVIEFENQNIIENGRAINWYRYIFIIRIRNDYFRFMGNVI